MNRAKRLQPVLRIAELDVEKAGRALAQAQFQLIHEETRLQQLRDYQQEYCNQLQAAGKAGITVDRLRLYDGFHQQLDRAITHQQQIIDGLLLEQQRLKNHWRTLDIRHKSLQKMLEKLQREAKVLQNRNEQRNHDDYARRRPGDSGWS